jgi:hypothetical protein
MTTPETASAEQNELLTRAWQAAQRAVPEEMRERWANEGIAITALSDEQAMAFALAMFVHDFQRMANTWPPVTKNVCGWCVRAAGDTKEAHSTLPTYGYEEQRAHVMACENNPLVVQLHEERSRVAEHLTAIQHLGEQLEVMTATAASRLIVEDRGLPQGYVTREPAVVVAELRKEIERLTKTVTGVENHLKSDVLRDRYPEILTGNDDESGERDSRRLTIVELVGEMVTEIASHDQAALDDAESKFAIDSIVNELNIEDDSPDAITAEIQRLRAVELQWIDKAIPYETKALDLEERLSALADEIAEHYPVAVAARALAADEATAADVLATISTVVGASRDVRLSMLPPRIKSMIGEERRHDNAERLFRIEEIIRALPAHKAPGYSDLINAITAVREACRG